MTQRKSTTIDLVAELAPYNGDGKLNHIIDEARAGEFHDFKNDKYVCGKIELVNKLAPFPELEHIRKGVMNGDYDESPDESDRATMRAELVADAGGDEEKARPLLEQMGLWEK